MRKITLASGQTLEAGMCGAADGLLVITPAVADIVSAVRIFGDTAHTARIACAYGGNVCEVFEGYTELISAMKPHETVTVMLRKAVTA